ncbi:MAG: hypothetical protein Satyrvirus44_2 [Satyrvirus sp.]|uniref:Uncharacterized protein n=1 Tax=Satyrvirus sp. TaxID=2487771 RepID=A0A3G5AF51_9VIRU|nr:MAG: hypothetical protein Satyrvirus44_2 [Satyrvirus sp.]
MKRNVINLYEYILNVPDLQIENVKLLLECGANPNICIAPPSGYIVDAAAERNRLDVLICLCESGAKLKGIDPDSMDHLYYAIKNNNIDMVKYLTENGATYTVAGGDLNSILVSISLERYEIAEYLASKGVKVSKSEYEWFKKQAKNDSQLIHAQKFVM